MIDNNEKERYLSSGLISFLVLIPLILFIIIFTVV